MALIEPTRRYTFDVNCSAMIYTRVVIVEGRLMHENTLSARR